MCPVYYVNDVTGLHQVLSPLAPWGRARATSEEAGLG
jgi:hypothetical protein